MPLDAPDQIDLSQDIKEQNIGLSPDQKESFQAYLDGLKEEEKQGIIYLTQQELSDLASTVEQSVSWENDAQDFVVHDSEKLDSFIEEQKTEWLASADILEGVEWNLLTSELLQQIDALSQAALFENGGIFDGLGISDTAKDHVSVSLSFTLVEQAQKNPAILQALKWNNPAPLLDLVEQYNTTFTTLGNTLRENEGIGWSFITQNGEGNGIFMETDTGKEFFEKILDWKIDQNSIVAYITENNKEDGGIINPTLWSNDTIKALIESGTLTQEKLTELLTNGAWWDTPPNWDSPNLPPDASPEDQKTWLEELKEKKPFGTIIAALLEAIKWFIPDELLEGDNIDRADRATDSPDETTSEQVAKTPSQQIRTFFSEHADSWIFVWVNKDSIAELFPSEWELPQEAKNILARIEAIPGEENIEDKLNNLFTSKVAKVDGDTSQWEVTKIERFLLDMQEVTDTTIDIKSADGSLNSAALLRAVHAYSSYRIRNEQWKAEDGNEDKQMPYSEFFRENTWSSEE